METWVRFKIDNFNLLSEDDKKCGQILQIVKGKYGYTGNMNDVELLEYFPYDPKTGVATYLDIHSFYAMTPGGDRGQDAMSESKFEVGFGEFTGKKKRALPGFLWVKSRPLPT